MVGPIRPRTWPVTRPKRPTKPGYEPSPPMLWDVERKCWHVGHLALIRCTQKPPCNACWYCRKWQEEHAK